MTRYVLITSGVIGATTISQRALVGRRFTSDPRVPVGSLVSVMTGGAEDYFGASSEEAAFARQYFGYISPAPVSQAQELQFAAYAPTGRGSVIFGDNRISSVADLAALGVTSLTIVKNGADVLIDAIDLSAAANYSDAVNAINAKITAEPETAGVSLSFSAASSNFTLTDSEIGIGTMSVLSGALASALGLFGSSAVHSPGVGPQTPLDAFLAAEQVSDSFGSASFQGELVLEEAYALSQYVAGENVKYQLYLSVTREDYLDYSSAFIGIASTGLVLNSTPGEYKEALPAAIMAATNYDRRDASVNYMFREGPFTGDVTTNADANTFDAARVNYYGTTSTAGRKYSFFQRGYLMGGAVDPLDMGVHANEQWLKSFLTSRFMSLLMSVGKVPANIDGRAMLMAQISEAITQGKINGTISIGSRITAIQKAAITQVTGDPLAWMDVENGGFWASIDIVENNSSPSGVTEYIAKYLIVYKKMDSVRKVEGSHNLV